MFYQKFRFLLLCFSFQIALCEEDGPNTGALVGIILSCIFGTLGLTLCVVYVLYRGGYLCGVLSRHNHRDPGRQSWYSKSIRQTLDRPPIFGASSEKYDVGGNVIEEEPKSESDSPIEVQLESVVQAKVAVQLESVVQAKKSSEISNLKTVSPSERDDSASFDQKSRGKRRFDNSGSFKRRLRSENDSGWHQKDSGAQRVVRRRLSKDETPSHRRTTSPVIVEIQMLDEAHTSGVSSRSSHKFRGDGSSFSTLETTSGVDLRKNVLHDQQKRSNELFMYESSVKHDPATSIQKQFYKNRVNHRRKRGTKKNYKGALTNLYSVTRSPSPESNTSFRSTFSTKSARRRRKQRKKARLKDFSKENSKLHTLTQFSQYFTPNVFYGSDKFLRGTKVPLNTASVSGYMEKGSMVEDSMSDGFKVSDDDSSSSSGMEETTVTAMPLPLLHLSIRPEPKSDDLTSMTLEEAHIYASPLRQVDPHLEISHGNVLELLPDMQPSTSLTMEETILMSPPIFVEPDPPDPVLKVAHGTTHSFMSDPDPVFQIVYGEFHNVISEMEPDPVLEVQKVAHETVHSFMSEPDPILEFQEVAHGTSHSLTGMSNPESLFDISVGNVYNLMPTITITPLDNHLGDRSLRFRDPGSSTSDPKQIALKMKEDPGRSMSRDVQDSPSRSKTLNASNSSFSEKRRNTTYHSADDSPYTEFAENNLSHEAEITEGVANSKDPQQIGTQDGDQEEEFYDDVDLAVKETVRRISELTSYGGVGAVEVNNIDENKLRQEIQTSYEAIIPKFTTMRALSPDDPHIQERAKTLRNKFSEELSSIRDRLTKAKEMTSKRNDRFHYIRKRTQTFVSIFDGIPNIYNDEPIEPIGSPPPGFVSGPGHLFDVHSEIEMLISNATARKKVPIEKTTSTVRFALEEDNETFHYELDDIRQTSPTDRESFTSFFGWDSVPGVK